MVAITKRKIKRNIIAIFHVSSANNFTFIFSLFLIHSDSLIHIIFINVYLSSLLINIGTENKYLYSLPFIKLEIFSLCPSWKDGNISFDSDVPKLTLTK